MTLAPWEYLFVPFNSQNFPDLFHPTWIASLVLLIVLVVLYNVRTRALHRHAVYLEMWEWLWWTGLITFRFVRFPPFFAAYEQKLARERYFSKQKYADPEATIRKRGGRPPQRQRRRRR